MIKSKCKSKKSQRHNPPSWKTIALYPHLQASLGTNFLEKQDLDILNQIHKSQKSHPKTLSQLTSIHVSRIEKGFRITNLGENYSPKYKKLTAENARASGLGKTLIACIKVAQNQGISSLLLEKQGGFPEPRRPASPHWEKLKSRPSQKQWEELLEGLQHFYQMWPLELLANILNSRSNKKPHVKTNKTCSHHPRPQRNGL